MPEIAYQQLLQAQSQHQVAREQNSAAASQQGLAELDLDCTADPDACAAVAEGSNSYYASTETDNLAAASEAAAYLQAVRPANAWDAVMGAAAAKQAAEADNSYESEEQRWVQKRLAEEAGPQYLDASALDLDCSGAADDDTAAECERTKAVNSYEAAPTSVLVSKWTLQLCYAALMSPLRCLPTALLAIDGDDKLQGFSGM